MKQGEAYILFQELQQLAPRAKGVVGFAVARNIRLLKTELTEYADKRMELFKTYGELSEDGSRYIIKPEAQGMFMREVAVYDDMELTIELMTITDEQLQAQDELTGEDMYLLDNFMINHN